MKPVLIALCLLIAVLASDAHAHVDHGAEGHVDPPGCMCLDCRAKRGEIVIPQGYTPDKAQFTVKQEWLKANPGKSVVELIPAHLSGLNNPNTPEGKAHLAQVAAQKAAQQAAAKAKAKESPFLFLVHPDALSYFGVNLPNGGKVAGDVAQAPKKKLRCKLCGSHDIQ